MSQSLSGVSGEEQGADCSYNTESCVAVMALYGAVCVLCVWHRMALRQNFGDKTRKNSGPLPPYYNAEANEKHMSTIFIFMNKRCLKDN